jgi:Uma2 family endonuclease
MSLAIPSAPTFLTAEQFGERPDPGHPEELVRGRIVESPVPKPRHGQICGHAYFYLRSFAESHDLGHVVCNDSGVITERGPDTVRGADVAFYSYARVPKGPLREGYLDVMPELVVEVVSPSDRWPKILAKVAEYLDAGISVVIVLDDEQHSARLFWANGMTSTLGANDELTLPSLLPGFAVAVSRFFE